MKLVIAIDGQQCADTVREHILAEKYDASTEIHLVHVLVPGFADAPVEGIPDVVAIERAEEQAVLDKLVQDLKEKLGVTSITAEILTGETAEVVAEACERFSADEVIVPTHSRHGFSRFWFGSVADDIVDATPCTAVVLKMPNLPKAR